ncbi:MAG: hypothetical protein HEQ39_15175 [Rhizobacter sp.]
MGANQARWAQKILPAVALGAAVGGAAGCRSLPSIPSSATAPTSAAPSEPSTVRLQGARGPLSAGQSKQVLDSLHSRRQDTDIFARHLAVEEAITTGPLTTGNAVLLLQDGPETYAAMLKAIQAARDHINLETYILDDDDVGRQFSEALLNMQQQGVQVHLIHDSVGTLSTPPEFFQRLREAGVQVLEFNPINPLRAWKEGKVWSPNRRDHRKLLILDGQTDSWLLFHAGRGTYDDLLQSGVKIHERRRAVLHSKTALIDGAWSTVGSTNLDWRSFLHNEEVNAVVLGTEFGDQMQRMFDTDRAASDPVLLPNWRDRSVLSRVQEWFAGLWAYLVVRTGPSAVAAHLHGVSAISDKGMRHLLLLKTGAHLENQKLTNQVRPSV